MTIYTLGETVLDIILQDINNIRVQPGGSMLNTAVSLGRLGLNVNHLSMISTDKASQMLIDFLEDNNVKCDYIYRDENLKTNLALAFLDKDNNADYTFYKNTLLTKPVLNFPDCKAGDIILFGSFYSLNTIIHSQLIAFLKKSKSNGAFIIYDPNFRKPHLPQLEKLRGLINANMRIANLVKASNEDFDHIFNVSDVNEAWRKTYEYDNDILVYTKGNKGANAINNAFCISTNAKKVKVISTVGAGDTFSAGIIFYLAMKNKEGVEYRSFTKDNWQECLDLASEFSGEVCKLVNNYLSKEFANKYK